MLKEFGYEKYIEPHPSQLIQAGREFEEVFKEMLEIVGVDFKHNKGLGNLRPDFQLDNGLIIDAKLSSWTPSIQSTIDKYHEKCDKLVIVYLRGEEDILEYYNLYDNTSIISVQEVLKGLPEPKRRKIQLKIQSLKDRIKDIDRND